MTVAELIAELQALADAGHADAPVMMRRYGDAGFEDEPAEIACLLPYNSREEPARVLID